MNDTLRLRRSKLRHQKLRPRAAALLQGSAKLRPVVIPARLHVLEPPGDLPRHLRIVREEQLDVALLRLQAAAALLGGADAGGNIDLEPSLGFDGVTVPTDDREGGAVLDEGEPNDWDGEDSDADEANGDLEPSLGGMAVMLRSGRIINDPEGDNSDLEYSLGWGFHMGSHGAANMVNTSDLEHDASRV